MFYLKAETAALHYVILNEIDFCRSYLLGGMV